MAYGLKYSGEYITEAGGATREVQIWEDGYTDGVVYTIYAMSEPNISVDGSDKKEAGVFGTECVFTLLTTDTFNADTLFHENPRHYKAKVIDGSTTLFVGWLQGDLAKDIYTADDDTRLFEVSATDGLGDLSDIDMMAVDGTTLIERESIRAFIGYALKATGLDLNLVTAVEFFDSYMSDAANMINQVTVDPKLWIEEEKTISTREVLESFCKITYSRLFQRNGKWHLICLDNQIEAIIPAYEYTSEGVQVTATTSFSHRKEIDSNPVGKTQTQLNSLIVSVEDKLQKSRQRPLKRLEINYDYGPQKNEVNGDLFGGSTEGWTFHDGIVHELFSLENSISSYGLELTGATKMGVPGVSGVEPYLYCADHLTTSTHYPYDEKYAAVFMAVKKYEKIDLSFDYLAPQCRGLKICVAFVFKNNDGVIKTESNIYDDLSTIARQGLGSDGVWYEWGKGVGGRFIRHLIIPNMTKDSQGNKVIKSGWENYQLSSTNGVPEDGWVVLYLYRGFNKLSDNDNATVKYRNLNLSRTEYGDILNNTVVVLENTNIAHGNATEKFDIKYGEPLNSLNYSYLARLNGARTNEQWDRTGINPATAIQALIGAMYLRQHSSYGVVLEGTLRANDLMFGDTLTLTGYADKVFLVTRLQSSTKRDYHEVTLVELFSNDFEPRYYTKSGSKLTAFYGALRNVFIPYFKYAPNSGANKRQGVEDLSGGQLVTPGMDVKAIENEFFNPDLEPQYEQPIQDPDTGDDIVGRIVTNAYGVIDNNQFPDFRLVKRNWRRHQEDLKAATNLTTLFVSPPVNEGNYRFLNGVDYYKTEAIETMEGIPEGVTGQAYVMVETADKFGKQVIIVPSTGKLFYRYKLENGTVTDWVELGMPDNIPQQNVINLVSDLLAFNNRLFSVEETNYTQDQSIQNIQTQLGYVTAINNQQDVLIKALQDAINALSGSNGDYVTKAQLNGGVLGAGLVKTSNDNQSFEFKRVHGIELVNFNIPIAKVGEYFEVTIPISSFIKSEFVWRNIQVNFLAFSDTWVDYSFTDNGGIVLRGTPTEETKETIYAMIGLNGFFTTYPLLVQSLADVSDASGLTASIAQNFPPKIALTWTYTGATPTEFKLYRRENGGTLGVITIIGGSLRSYEDSTANSDRNIDYQIEPIVGGIAGTRSNIASVKTPAVVVTTGGLYGRFYPNKTLSSPALISVVVPTVDFIWTGVEPQPGFGQSINYSVRFTGYLKWPTTGTVKFRTRSDDGIRVWVGGTQVIDQWRDYSVVYGIWEFTADLVAETNKDITIEYYQGEGGAEIHFEYQDATGVWKTVPQGYLVPEIAAGETLPAPVLTSAVSTGENSQNIDWTYTGDVDNFTLQRSLTGSTSGLWINAGTFATAVRTGDVAGLTAGTRYYWRIKANYQGRSSDWSNIINATTDAGTVVVPPSVDGQRAILWMFPNFAWDNFEDNNAITSRAVEAGVVSACISPDWWELEQAENSYNFDELKYRIQKQKAKGLGYQVQIPHRFAYKPKDNNPEWQMISSSTQHRWNGSAWTTTTIAAKDCAYLDYSEAIVCRDAGYMLDAIGGAQGSASSAAYMTAQRRLAAKLAHYIYSDSSLSEGFYGFLYCDGGSTETGFGTASKSTKYEGAIRTETYAFQDGDYSTGTKTEFGVWLRGNYSDLAAFKAAWNTTNEPEFMATYGYNYNPDVWGTNGDQGVVDYGKSARTRDWFKFLVEQKRRKYAAIINAVKLPSSIVSGLISSTSAKMFAYWTEHQVAAQALTWAAGAVEMLKDFDAVLSSSGSNGGAVVRDSHFKSFKLRMSTLRGTIPSQSFGQELDTERGLYSDGGLVGPSKTMRTIFDEGATYFCVTFFRQVNEWDDAIYSSIDGRTLSFKDDLRLGYLTYIKDKTRVLPVVSQTLNYNYDDMLSNVSNPNNTTESFISITNPDAAGMSSTHIDIKMNR